MSLLLFVSSLNLTCRSWEKFYAYEGGTPSLTTGSNLRANAELGSAVIFGLLPDGAVGMEYVFDGGTSFKSATIAAANSRQWQASLPVGAEAAAGLRRWQIGSRHTLSVRAIDKNGYRSEIVTVSFLRQLNRDVNGDGYSDFVVGADLGQGTGAADKGLAYVIYGSASGTTNQPLSASTYTCNAAVNCTTLQNPDNESPGYFGVGVAIVGDVNGDGFADVLIGANRNQGAGMTDKGIGYIFYGSANGVTSHPASASAYTCSGPPDCTPVQNPEEELNGFFAYYVAAAGDVNGDGYADVIMSGDRNQGVGSTDKGAVYVFFGSATGVKSHPGVAAAYSCSGPPDCTVIQNPENLASGKMGLVSHAGDINGDGYGDLLVGAYSNAGAGALTKGVAYVFYGSATGPAVRPLTNNNDSCTGIANCTAIQNPDNEPSGNFGISVSYAGDVNNDGYADIVVGARNNQGGAIADKGAAYVFYGSASGVTSHPTSITPYACSGPPDCTLIQNPENINVANFGISVGNAGDINGDGIADIVVGGYGNSGAGATYKGAAYIYFGSTAGVTGHAFNTATYACNGPPDCTVIQNPQDEASGYFGYIVVGAGDINADGYPDIAVTAYQNAAPGFVDKGAVYIHYGSASGPVSHPTSTLPYNCSGPPDCSVIQNPDNESPGEFGLSAG